MKNMRRTQSEVNKNQNNHLNHGSKNVKQFCHPICHLINCERLYYVFLSLKGPIDNLRAKITEDLRSFDLFKSSCIYPLFGQSDILIRIWSPPPVFKKFYDKWGKSAYTADRNVFLIGEIETWYQREIEKSALFLDEMKSSYVNKIINNPGKIAPTLRYSVTNGKKHIHFYIFLDGAMTLSEDVFSQVRNKLRNSRYTEDESEIKKISIYSYYTQDRKGVLLKAEVENYEKSAKTLARLARWLKPIGGKTLTFVCQETENVQGDSLYPIRVNHEEDFESAGMARNLWSHEGVQSSAWKERFTSYILETQEFDEEFLKDFHGKIGSVPNKKGQKAKEAKEAFERYRQAEDITKKFRVIVTGYAPSLAQAYQFERTSAFQEDWWALIFDLRKLYKWTAMKNDSRLRAFFMAKFVMFEKALHDTIVPLFPRIIATKREQRKTQFEEKIIEQCILKEFDKIEREMVAPLKFERPPASEHNPLPIIDSAKELRTRFQNLLKRSNLLECLKEVSPPFSPATDLTLGTIKSVILDIIKLLQNEHPEFPRAKLEDLRAHLEECMRCRNDLMHGKVDTYFGHRFEETKHHTGAKSIYNWEQVLEKYIAFRLQFPGLLKCLQDAVELLKLPPSNQKSPHLRVG